MASVLDRLRAHEARTGHRLPVDQAQALPDEEFDRYIREVTALPKRKQKGWKARTERTDGTVSTIRFDGTELYGQWLNQRVRVISASEFHGGLKLPAGTEHVREMEGICPRDWDARMDAALAASYTGKHTGRNHFIPVPTRAGEPCLS